MENILFKITALLLAAVCITPSWAQAADALPPRHAVVAGATLASPHPDATTAAPVTKTAAPLAATDAETPPAWSTAATVTVQHVEVVIQGQHYTRGAYLARTLKLKPGARFDADTLADDLQRIRNYEIFLDVTATVTQVAPDAVTVAVIVTDRWSWIPVLRPNGGGGVFTLKLGVRDTNFLGANQDLAVYAGPYFGQGNRSYLLGVEWFIRHLFSRHGADIVAVRDFYVEPVYDGATAPTKIETETVSGEFKFRYNEHDYIRPALTFAAARRDFRVFMGPAFPGLPSRLVTLEPGAELTLGRVDYNNYRFTGYDFTLRGGYAFRPEGPAGFWRAGAEGRAFWLPYRRLNLATRLQVFANGATAYVDDQTLDGLTGMRGFPSRYLRLNAGAALNNEVRVTAAEALFRLIYVGVVALYDVALVDGGARGDGLRVHHALGGGLRLAFIPAYGMYLRIDVAHALDVRALGFDLGIGITEFF